MLKKNKDKEERKKRKLWTPFYTRKTPTKARETRKSRTKI